MCIQIKTIFRCNCPHQNTLLCPHHIYIRATQQEIEKGGKYADDGFQLRLESALQARKDWTPLQPDDELVAAYPKWEHCSVYKARHQTEAGDVKSGKEPTCTNWIQNHEHFSKLVRGLCAECIDGHGVRKPSPVKGRFIEEIDVQASVTVNVIKTEDEIRPNTLTSMKGISQQTPLRKILSKAKQNVIRHNMGIGGGGGGGVSRSSTPIHEDRGSPEQKSRPEDTRTGKKEKDLPDVFARLLLGTGSGTKGKGGGTSSGPNTPTKRPVSRQTKGAGRAGK